MSLLSRFLPTFVAFSCLAASSALAQQGSAVTGSLAGSVTDSSGALIGGADITLIGPQGQRSAKSDALGRYAIDNLVPGFYDVTVQAPGFKKVESKHNEVVVNVSSSLNLKLAVGSTAELVEVNASAIAINTESNAIDANLTDTFYNSVPMARNVASLFYAAPGVVAGLESSAAMVPGVGDNGPGASNPSIGGATGLENLYVVDGVTITDQAFGSLGTSTDITVLWAAASILPSLKKSTLRAAASSRNTAKRKAASCRSLRSQAPTPCMAQWRHILVPANGMPPDTSSTSSASPKRRQDQYSVIRNTMPVRSWAAIFLTSRTGCSSSAP